MSETQTPAAACWYLSNNGKTSGPFTDDDIVASMLERSVSPDTLACPDGGAAWQALYQWPVFADVALQIQPGIAAAHLPPVPPKQPAGMFIRRVILWYALGVNPFLMLMGTVDLFVIFSYLDTTKPFFAARVWLNIAFWSVRMIVRIWAPTTRTAACRLALSHPTLNCGWSCLTLY